MEPAQMITDPGAVFVYELIVRALVAGILLSLMALAAAIRS